LINGLTEDLPEIRLAAVKELAAIQSDRTFEALKRALEDPDRSVQVAAVDALGNTADEKAVEPLLNLIAHGDQELANQGAKSVQRFGNTITKQIIGLSLNFNPHARKLSAEVLGNIGDTAAITPLINLLKDEHPEVVGSAIEALGKLADPATLERILPFLQHGDVTIRETAATALGEIGESLAAEPLLGCLRDNHDSVRLAAVRALGKISDPVSVEALINSLNDNSMRVREAAAEAIGNMGAYAVKPLIAILGDWDKDVQAIRKALTTIGTGAIRPLINALSSNDSKVSEAAAKVLDNLGWQPANDENSAAYYIAKKQWLNTVRIGQPAVKPLIAATKDPDVWVRTGAVESLGNIADRAAVEPLILMFMDKFWNVRDAAVEALVKIGEPAVERLIEVLNERNSDTVEYAARALGAIGDEQAIEPLNDALFDEFKKVRRAAAGALEKMGALSSGRRCSNCGKPVPRTYRTGDSCPFCDELLDI
jgi:HEAT repeat protein